MAGLIVDWGNTGATNSGLDTSYSLMTPTLYFGKGFGELPDTLSWARPFAMTGQVGYEIPTQFATTFDFDPDTGGPTSFRNQAVLRRDRCSTACRT